MLLLNAAEVRRALPMSAAIEAMRRAFVALSDGLAEVPMRAHLAVEPHNGISIVMPAYVRDKRDEALMVKVVSLFAENPKRGLPLIHAAVLALNPETGRPFALIEGAALTAIRTGAASGLATDLLARPESRTAAILGAGVQARTQLEAICTVCRIETVWVYDPIQTRVEALITEMAANGPVTADLRPAGSAREALADADIVCAATTATAPAFADADLKAGAHVNAIGSYQPDKQEVPPETVARAMVVVDCREAALAETGDLVQPIRQGLITPEHIHAELGELILGRKSGRASAGQITLYKAVGVAVQDAVAARTALKQAEKLGLGQRVAW